MWAGTFDERLIRWHDLRQSAAAAPIESCLLIINQWWFQSPWRPYYLHWDDQAQWPNPWQLLDDNVYCDLARCLGIVYTLLMVESTKSLLIEIAETNAGNLVLVDQGKYILNWDADQILNISSVKINKARTLDSSKLAHLLG